MIMVKQTAVIYSLVGELDFSFFVVDEDITKFDGVYINQWINGYTNEQILELEILYDELNEYFYDSAGDFKLPMVTRDGLVQAIRDGATLIMCGFVL